MDDSITDELKNGASQSFLYFFVEFDEIIGEKIRNKRKTTEMELPDGIKAIE